MKGRSLGSASLMLRKRWAEWAAIVELFARRRPARRHVDPAAYGTLHRELIDACRAMAESAGEDGRAYYRDLEGIIEPWLNPRTLAQADSVILAGLMARSLRIKRELGARSVTPYLVIIIKCMLLIGLVAGCVILMQVTGVDMAPSLSRMRGASDTLWMTMTRSSDMQRLGAAAFLVVLVSHRLLSRTTQG